MEWPLKQLIGELNDEAVATKFYMDTNTMICLKKTIAVAIARDLKP